jgi:hypothetical protein
MIVARILPCPDACAPRHRFLNSHLSSDGRMERRSELTRGAAPRPPRDFHLESALDSNRTTRTDAGSTEEPTTLVFTQELVCGGLRSLTKCA